MVHLLQNIYLDGMVLRLLGDEEPHVLELDLGRRGPDHLARARHRADRAGRGSVEDWVSLWFWPHLGINTK